MRCRIHFAPIQYIDIRVGQDQKNRGLCQRCLQKQLETGIISLKDGEDLMNQVYLQRSDELVKIQTLYEGIFKEIQVLLDANKLKIFEILLQLYQKSVFVYEYSECQQLADQLSKDIIFNENQLQIKPLLYQDPILQKNQTALTEILNILKPKLEKMEIEVDVVKYQIIRPPMYSNQAILINGHREQVSEVAFSNDCTMAASGSHDSRANLWCLKTKSLLKQYKGHKGVMLCIAFSKSDSFLASGEHYNRDNAISQIMIWDIKNLKLNKPLYKLNEHTSAIYHLKFAQNFLISSSVDGSIRLWKEDKQIQCYQMKGGVMGVALSKDESLIAGNSEVYNSIWHVGKGRIISKWQNLNQNGQGSLCFSNNSKLFFQSSCNRGKLNVWNCYTENPKLIRKAKFSSVMRLIAVFRLILLSQLQQILLLTTTKALYIQLILALGNTLKIQQLREDMQRKDVAAIIMLIFLVMINTQVLVVEMDRLEYLEENKMMRGRMNIKIQMVMVIMTHMVIIAIEAQNKQYLIYSIYLMYFNTRDLL